MAKNPALAVAYHSFLAECLQLKHMEPVPSLELHRSSYYMPHHAVWRPDTGKIRVVFNASQPDVNGQSLNQLMLPGPKLQKEISAVITQWRIFKIAFVADVIKMFRQTLVHRDDRDWQRIVWRPQPNGPILDFRTTTVTYGTSAAPFLSLRAIQQLSEDGAPSHPEAANILRHQIYVDDIFAGGDDISIAAARKDQLISLLQTAGMSLDKWASNAPSVLSNTSSPSVDLNVKESEVVSTLGLKWLTLMDCFCFEFADESRASELTKRAILSQIARLFDPLGWLVPIVITAKIILQDLWLDNIDWDTPIQGELHRRWSNFRDALLGVSTIKIPRWVGCMEQDIWHLHGFADASKRAYAASVYAVVPGTRATLLMAKTKLAPTKVQTLPRLELNGAVLAVRLAKHILSGIQHQPIRIHFWTDSTIVLEWLKSHPSRWQTFIANRTSEIVSQFPTASWMHVKSQDNPADCATRGLTPTQLEGFDLWWNGPPWLTQGRLACFKQSP